MNPTWYAFLIFSFSSHLTNGVETARGQARVCNLLVTRRLCSERPDCWWIRNSCRDRIAKEIDAFESILKHPNFTYPIPGIEKTIRQIKQQRLLVHIAYFSPDPTDEEVRNLENKGKPESGLEQNKYKKFQAVGKRVGDVWRRDLFKYILLILHHMNRYEFEYIEVIFDVADYTAMNRTSTYTNYLRQVASSGRYPNLNIFFHEHDLGEYRYSLAMRHRADFKKRVDGFDWFLYTEDDHLIPWEVARNHMSMFHRLLKRNYMHVFNRLFFLRDDASRDGMARVFMTDPRWRGSNQDRKEIPNSEFVHVNGLPYIIREKAYPGAWIYPQDLIKRWIRYDEVKPGVFLLALSEYAEIAARGIMQSRDAGWYLPEPSPTVVYPVNPFTKCVSLSGGLWHRRDLDCVNKHKTGHALETLTEMCTWKPMLVRKWWTKSEEDGEDCPRGVG